MQRSAGALIPSTWSGSPPTSIQIGLKRSRACYARLALESSRTPTTCTSRPCHPGCCDDQAFYRFPSARLHLRPGSVRIPLHPPDGTRTRAWIADVPFVLQADTPAHFVGAFRPTSHANDSDAFIQSFFLRLAGPPGRLGGGPGPRGERYGEGVGLRKWAEPHPLYVGVFCGNAPHMLCPVDFW